MAMGMPALIGAAGLAVDTAQWYVWRGELQYAIDAGSCGSIRYGAVVLVLACLATPLVRGESAHQICVARKFGLQIGQAYPKFPGRMRGIGFAAPNVIALAALLDPDELTVSAAGNSR